MLKRGASVPGPRFVLETAMKTRNLVLAEWALARGASPNAEPARDKRVPKRGLYELAAVAQFGEMAELLVHYGATRSALALEDHERFLHACFGLDRDE